MSLITSSIPNLVNGVSQQPYALRLASQGEKQVNGLSSIVEGLRKRPQSRHLAKMSSSTVGNAFVHMIDRDKNERYIVVMGHQQIRVFDLQGNEKTVSTPDGVSYLSSNDPKGNFDAVTVADYTFIVNKDQAVKRSGKKQPSRQDEAMFWVKQGAYGGKYTITVNGSTVSYETPDGSDPSHSKNIATDYIANQLLSKIKSAKGGGYSMWTVGSVVYIKRTDGASLSVSSSDSLGNTALITIGKNIQRFSELPSTAQEGFCVTVTGDNTSKFDNYYVKYQNGVWVETARQGEHIELNGSTMPHALVREADGSFTFRAITWSDRQVGDLDSDPFPSFIDRGINDIFFHRNRLGFVSDENVIMSKAGDYWNFFRGTATQVLDDDPIDIGVSHVKVSILRHAIPFNETLLLFSDQTQFQLGRSQILTPDTVSINQTTEYECSLKAKPGAAGRFVYFTVNRGSNSGLREYYVNGDTEVEEAADVTGHVPKYIPGDVFKIASSSNEDILVLLSEKEPNHAYVYRYYWEGEEKIQASWSRWEFDQGDRILNADFIESELILVIERDDGVYVEIMGLEPDRTEPNMPHAVYLDRMIGDEYTAETFYEATGKTHVELPYWLRSDQEPVLVTAQGGSRAPGLVISSQHDNSGDYSVLVVDGDFVDQPFYVGLKYRFEYIFSQLALRESSSGGGTNTITAGRTQLRKLDVSYSNTGYFKAQVTPFRRGTYEYVFSGRVIGSARNPLGEISIEDGSFQFPLLARNDQVEIKLVNDSYLPSAFLSAEWEAYFTTRSKRI